jgi:hypothetical protein
MPATPQSSPRERSGPYTGGRVGFSGGRRVGGATHRCRLNDEEQLPEAVPIEQLGPHTENGSVPVIEGRARPLPLQHAQLVA